MPPFFRPWQFPRALGSRRGGAATLAIGGRMSRLSKLIGQPAPGWARLRLGARSPRCSACSPRRPPPARRSRWRPRRSARSGRRPGRRSPRAVAARYAASRWRRGPARKQPRRKRPVFAMRRDVRDAVLNGPEPDRAKRMSGCADSPIRVDCHNLVVNPPICGDIWRFAISRVQSPTPVLQSHCVARAGPLFRSIPRFL